MLFPQQNDRKDGKIWARSSCNVVLRHTNYDLGSGCSFLAKRERVDAEVMNSHVTYEFN